MPLYHYYCEACRNEFCMLCPMREYQLPRECPACGGQAPRMLYAPYLSTMPTHNRIAHQRNEQSADAPRVERRQVGGAPRHHHPSRPWMIGH